MFILNLSSNSTINVFIERALKKNALSSVKNRYETSETYEVVLKQQHDLYSYNEKYNSFYLSITQGNKKPKIQITYLIIFKISYLYPFLHA